MQIHTPFKCLCMQLSYTWTHSYTHILEVDYLQIPLSCLLAWSRATAFPRSSPRPWQGRLLSLQGVLVGDLSMGSRQEYNLNISAISVFESSYCPVEADKVPCQGINCLPSGNATGITPTILWHEMKTKIIHIANLRETVKEQAFVMVRH